MHLQTSMTQHQTTKLNITPRLVQAIRMLQMSSDELAGYLQEQSDGNPLLDVAVRGDDGLPGQAWRYDSFNADKVSRGAVVRTVAEREETLAVMLLRQLRMRNVSSRLYAIAAYLAGNLDERGYLAVCPQTASEQLQEPLPRVEAALALLQSLEPAGIAARTLQECLQLQVSRDPNADEWASPIIARYLQDWASGKWRRITDGLGITAERLERAMAYIRALDPHPGASFGNDRAIPYIRPDAIVRKEKDGFVVVLNESGMPTISINKRYERLLAAQEGQEERAYGLRCLQAAKWLQHCLKQRMATLARVVEAIVEEQVPFLEHGVDHLKPMTLKTIADKLRMHESTVSRAVQSKYVQIPHGVYELKLFFTTGLATSAGGIVSAESVKAKLRLLIEQEDKTKPRSDQQLADLLTGAGFRISRRTVVKYREQLRIASSRLRGGRPGRER